MKRVTSYLIEGGEGRKSDFGTNFAKAERRGGRDGEENDTFHQRANLSIGTCTHF